MRFERRELEITPAGKWFLALTVILGTSAVLSGNNLLYLIECALLGGLVVSGLISEHAIASLESTILRRPAIAEESSRDLVRIKNCSRFPVLQVSVGEWRGGTFYSLAYLPEVKPKAEITVRSQEWFETRGDQKWDALAVSTRAPFGFARKTRVHGSRGARKVWPARPSLSAITSYMHDQGRRESRRAGALDVVEGEVRPVSSGEDARAIVWLLSMKGDPVTRRLSPSSESLKIRLDLREELTAADFERRIRTAAASFYEWTQLKPQALREKHRASLEIVTFQGSERFQGALASLDHLATLSLQNRAA